MRFIHSNKQYIERTMYPINPYMNTPAVPTLTMEAFVAPANFDPDAQELNIVKAFAAYPNANKKYIFSVGTSATTVLPAVTGRSYAYAQNGGAYTTIVSGTVTWTVGSTKRNVVVIDSASSVIANIYSGGIWLYISDKCTDIYASSIYGSNGNSLKYIHLQSKLSLTSIANYAFQNCSALTGALTIPNSVTTIGGYSFQNCSALTGALTIPNSVTTIGGYAFNGCSGLIGDLTIPNSVTSIGSTAFANCSGLTGTLTIPNSVISIGSIAFYGCSKLTGNLTIPDSVTSIGDIAFYDCSGLTSITSSSSYYPVFENILYESKNNHIKSIFSVYNLTNILLRADTTSIGLYSFYSHSKVTGTLTIPNSVTSIESYAFYGCSKLIGNLNIPNSVTSIGDNAFRNCSGLTGTLTIPNSVTSIESYVFYECSGLTGTLTIPNSVTSIGRFAFYGCSGLIGDLTIPNSVTSIGGTAFANCSGVTSITNRRSIPQIGLTGDTFYNVNKTIPLHVPVGSLAAYQTAPYWNEFTNIIADL